MKTESARVPTGIEGLDKLMEGGFPEGDAILVTGTPGTGKSILALQYIVEGARKHDQKGVYITFEKSLDTLKARSMRLGWDLAKLEQDGRILLLDPEIKPEFGEDPMDWITSDEVKDRIREFNPDRVAVDSLTTLMHYSSEFGSYRRGINEILREFRIGCTALFIHERESGKLDGIIYTPEEFIVDGILYMQLIRVGEEYMRALTVLKMRGTKHPLTINPLEITGEGIKLTTTKKGWMKKN